MKGFFHKVSLIVLISVIFSCTGSVFAALPEDMGTDYGAWEREAPASVAMPTPEPTPTPEPVYEGGNVRYREVEIGRASTTYGTYASQANRNTNMQLATQAIDYSVINNGDVFSFNSTVGPRTAARGYKEATVFVGKEKVPGLGGGICQISSTLYMAVKSARLQVVERHQHSLAVTYCSEDDEATVSWGYLDFKFRNNSGDPIRIEASCKGGVARVIIYQRVPVYD